MKCFVLLLVFLSSTPRVVKKLCRELKAQESLDITKLMGKWYIIEVLQQKFKTPDLQNELVIRLLDSCPTVNLRFTDNGGIKLLWTESKGDLDYTFQIEDIIRSPGIWRSVGLQNGTLTEQPYTQFVGTVHVMKVVVHHLVLTFCSQSPGVNLYSVILSREHILPKNQITGIHGLLERRQLQTTSILTACAKGTASTLSGTSMITMHFTISLIVLFSFIFTLYL
ncbi:hypothetical protein HCN44_008873 [Aphidius gifuensis]|uniref:Odorant-binding protein n=1 Tax=Aphidius gifuensis TaxID=684658 RepID=A0A835CYI7_APHGI|nr:uncharacterized protein LOC122848327 [Aphidius gifuensis]KAF7997700.1 hypothetical protein HCN44_008873 [Aphidius gifuensis]